MRIEKHIVGKLARRVETVVIAHTKRSLRQLGGGSLLSGEDSPLRNVWDEICAQQQGEESFYWSAYEEIIDQILLDKVNHLDRASLLALWTQTDDGFDCLEDHHADEDGVELVSVDHGTVVTYLRRLLLREATDEDNEHIQRYLYPEDYNPGDDGDERELQFFCQRIISGGQTGVDRAALDFAIEYGYPYGGWAPRRREAEDGPIPPKYQLIELTEGGYRQRTKRNVEDSNATLIINIGALDGGTLATKTFAQKLGRPYFVAQLDTDTLDSIALCIVEWLQAHSIQTLNVAGPRESKRPGIYCLTRELLDAIATRA